MHRRIPSAARWLPVAAALLGASCAARLNQVEGKVLYNGQPAKGAVVVFHPQGKDDLTTRHPAGVTGDDGTFSLSTQQPGDGAAPGDYDVTITWPEEAKPAKPTFNTEPPPDPPDRLGGRYADRKRPQFTATVKAGKNQLPPFEIK